MLVCMVICLQRPNQGQEDMMNPHDNIGLCLLDDLQSKAAHQRSIDLLLVLIDFVCLVVMVFARHAH